MTATATLVFLAVSTVAGVAPDGPGEGAPVEGREREVARDLLGQARRRLEAQYRANPSAGFRYTGGVAAALAELGDHEAAEATIGHVLLVNRFGDVHLRALAVGYARGGDPARVRQTIARVRDADPGYALQKPLAWREAGRALAESGRPGPAAEAFAEAVRGTPERGGYPSQDADFLAAVAEGQHGIGLADEASATLKAAAERAHADPGGTMRTIGLSKVASAQAGLGFLPEALATVDRIAGVKERWWAWYGVVDAAAGAGRLDDAYRVAGRVEGDAVVKTWLAIAAAEAGRGRATEAAWALAKAGAAVERIAAPGYRIETTVLLAEARAAVGDRAAAEAGLARAAAIADGAVIVEDGPFAVLRRVERVPGAVHRQFNLRRVAAAQAKLGLAEAARRTFERAKVAARGEQPGLWQESALTIVANSQAEAGMPDEALRTLEELPEASRGWLTYKEVAKARARAGDLDGALREASRFPNDGGLLRGYIAEALLEAGDPAGALRVALGSAPREEVLHDAARRLAAAGDMARVTDAVPRAYVEDRVALLLGAAEGLLDRARRRAGPPGGPAGPRR